MNLKNARVIITGGSTGIGFETARLLKEAGADVLICARDQEALNKAATELQAEAFAADVSDSGQVKGLFEYALQKLGGLDVLINNAGVGYMGSLVDTPVGDFTRIWEINTKGAFLCGQLAAKHFIAQNSGNIINVASMGAVNGFANGSAYASSKAAMTGLTMCWRAELRKHNIRVTQINPSEVVTPFSGKIGFENSNPERKLHGVEIAQAILGVLSLNDVGFIPEVNVWATNP
jgi:3-oxoacyl-[acyl-carrier protein] reductase